jgi:hypothetical protein
VAGHRAASHGTEVFVADEEELAEVRVADEEELAEVRSAARWRIWAGHGGRDL